MPGNREYNQKYWKKNKDKIMSQRNLNKDRLNTYAREWRKKNADKYKERYTNYRIARRLKVLEHYSNGTPYCACCKEDQINFLSIDHLNGDGSSHRKEIGNNNSIVSWIIKNNYPKGFQVLCFNCNLSKGFYGICPHNLKR